MWNTNKSVFPNTHTEEQQELNNSKRQEGKF